MVRPERAVGGGSLAQTLTLTCITLTPTLSRYGPSEPWVEAVKLAAADLFELLAAIVERWVKELTAKAVALVAS